LAEIKPQGISACLQFNRAFCLTIYWATSYQRFSSSRKLTCSTLF